MYDVTLLNTTVCVCVCVCDKVNFALKRSV